MVMGPHDSGKTVNKELVKIHKILHHWFQERDSVSASPRDGSQGWLEFLYGVVLAKERNEKDAMEYLIRSVQAFPMNWGAWLEIANLVNSYTEVCALRSASIRSLLTSSSSTHCAAVYLETSTLLSSTSTPPSTFTNPRPCCTPKFRPSFASSQLPPSSSPVRLFCRITPKTSYQLNANSPISSPSILIALTRSIITAIYYT